MRFVIDSVARDYLNFASFVTCFKPFQLLLFKEVLKLVKFSKRLVKRKQFYLAEKMIRRYLVLSLTERLRVDSSVTSFGGKFQI
jgi:hypothetical protein